MSGPWMMLRKLRRAMVAAEREPLKREVEVDEFFLGRFSRPKRWASAGNEGAVRRRGGGSGRGSGRLRLAILKDARKPSLSALMTATDRVRRDRSLEGLLQAVWPSPATTMPRRANGPSPSVTCRTCHAHVERSRTLRHGCMAPPPCLAPATPDLPRCFRHNRRGNPRAAFQTLLGLSTRHQPVRRRQIIEVAA
jgi:hypothetical protein